MTFIIPKNGKMFSVGKRLLTIPEGEFKTEDTVLIKLLEGAEGVTKAQSKSTKAPL